MKLGLIPAALLLASAFAADASAADYVIEIKSLQFGAAPPHLVVGDTIEWKNADIFQHTATARDGQFDVTLAAKATGAVTLKKAGPIDVFCKYHPNMKLHLVVDKGE